MMLDFFPFFPLFEKHSVFIKFPKSFIKFPQSLDRNFHACMRENVALQFNVYNLYTFIYNFPGFFVCHLDTENGVLFTNELIGCP